MPRRSSISTRTVPASTSNRTVPPAEAGGNDVVWYELDASWFDATENGTLTVVTDFAIVGGVVTCSHSLAAIRDGLTEGMTKRASAAGQTAIETLLGTTSARLLNGDDTLLVRMQPDGAQGNGACLGVGWSNDVAKANMDGAAFGYRGGAVADEERAWSCNATQDDAALTGSTDTGPLFGSVELGPVNPQVYGVGFDAALTQMSQTEIVGTALSGGSNLRLVLTANCAFAAGGNSNTNSAVWIGLRKNERAGL